MRTLSLFLLLTVVLVSGCATTQVQTVTLPVVESKYNASCRLDHYSCNDQMYFTPCMNLMNKLLADLGFTADDPYAAPIGLSCNILIDQRVDPSAQSPDQAKILWFVRLELEFYQNKDKNTMLKYIREGHTNNGNDVVGLVADIAGPFFNRASGRGNLTVPVAKGMSDQDKFGRAALTAGDLGGAITFFQNALDRNPDDHAARYNLGLTYEMLGRNDQAIACYRKAQELFQDPLYEQAIVRINNQQ